MDNLTHTLMGLVAGEVVARHARSRPDGLQEPARRTALLALGMLGGNLPDVDLLWSIAPFTRDPLDYLVHHRGHTHTIPGCVVLALAMFAGVLAILRWRGHRVSAADARLLGGMALLAVMLHLGMDALNVYGVHPFWPWDSRWYYGDTVFIVEPLFWLAAATLLPWMRARPARIALGVVLAAGSIAVLVFHRFAAAWWVVPLLSVLLVVGGRRLGARAASVAALGVLGVVMGMFVAAHAAATRRVQDLALQQFPGARTLDLVLSPAPAHPFCWDVMLLQAEGSDYVARMGQLGLLPRRESPCARSLNASGTAPLRNMNQPVVAGLRWTGEYTMQVGALARLANSNCDTRRLASFLRAPFAARSEQGWVIGDLRFDREPGAGFAEWLVVPQSQRQSQPQAPCTPSPWRPPRADLGF